MGERQSLPTILHTQITNIAKKERNLGAVFQGHHHRKKHTLFKLFYPLSKAITDYHSVIIDRLGSRELLAGCLKCRTQNINEFFHDMIFGHLHLNLRTVDPSNQNSL